MAQREFIEWMWRQRNSTRLAFILQTGWRVGNALMGLVWTRLLFHAMGRPLYGLFSSFQSVAALGGLGELGLGGAVAIRTGQHLGRGEDRELSQFLATARSVFLLLALLTVATFAVLSPWLPHWLGFVAVPGAGSLTTLFLVGAGSIGLLLLLSYLNNLNYACGNLVWPIVPLFLFGQGTFFAQWLLARAGAPLWVQYLPWLVGSLLGLVTAWTCVRLSHPLLAQLRALRFDWPTVASLIQKSFWVYLCGLGNVIYTTTDRLLINGVFGPAEVPRYHLNYKLCDLAVFAILAASFVSLPKITQWLASSSPDLRVRVLTEARRLSQFQTVLGCAAALFYLGINDVFMRVWLNESMLAPLAWQIAFALNLAITAGGDAAVQIASRIGNHGMRVTGQAVAITGTLNLVLSFAAAQAQWIAGIALATVLAQTMLNVLLSRFVCRELGLSWAPWFYRTCALPIVFVSLAGAARYAWPPDSALHVTLLVGSYLLIFLAVARLAGLNLRLLRDEARQIRSMFRR